jgi:hypothetical protein
VPQGVEVRVLFWAPNHESARASGPFSLSCPEQAKHLRVSCQGPKGISCSAIAENRAIPDCA